MYVLSDEKIDVKLISLCVVSRINNVLGRVIVLIITNGATPPFRGILTRNIALQTKNSMPTAKTKTPSSIDFEAALTELNQIVEQMEQGGLKLEDALQKFEHGISLIRHCQATLKTAEQKVQILIEQNGKTSLAPFEDGDAG